MFLEGLNLPKAGVAVTAVTPFLTLHARVDVHGRSIDFCQLLREPPPPQSGDSIVFRSLALHPFSLCPQAIHSAEAFLALRRRFNLSLGINQNRCRRRCCRNSAESIAAFSFLFLLSLSPSR